MTPRLAVPLVAALALSPAMGLACAAEPPVFDGGSLGLEGGPSISVGRMADRDWRVVMIEGQPVPEEAKLWLSVAFADGKVTGHTGCNSFGGMADLDAGWMALGPLAVTEMACDATVMAREAAFLKALAEVQGFLVTWEGALYLRRGDGSVALCLR